MTQQTRDYTLFRLLGAHGVPPAQIAVIESHFGEGFRGVPPLSLFEWGFKILLWPETSTILSGWVDRAARKGDIRVDRRVKDAIDLLDGGPIDHDHVVRVERDALEMVETLSRLRGLDKHQPLAHAAAKRAVGHDLLAWAAVSAAVSAAHLTVCRDARLTSGVAESCCSVLGWLLAQADTSQKAKVMDNALQEVMTAVTNFLRTWVPGKTQPS